MRLLGCFLAVCPISIASSAQQDAPAFDQFTPLDDTPPIRRTYAFRDLLRVATERAPSRNEPRSPLYDAVKADGSLRPLVKPCTKTAR